MILPEFNYFKPKNIEDAIDLLSRNDAKPLAGGTDIVVHMREGKSAASMIVDLKDINELKGIYEIDNKTWIGALSTMREISKSPILKSHKALVQGAKCMGCHEIRFRATIGGNVCNASPSGDVSVPLLLYDTQVVIQGQNGERSVELESFFKGYGKVDLGKGEVVKGFFLKKTPTRSCYQRSTRVKGMDLASVSLAMGIEEINNEKKVYLSLGAVMPKPIRMREIEDYLKGSEITDEKVNSAYILLKELISPREGSLRATPWYKKEMINYFLKKGLTNLLEEVTK